MLSQEEVRELEVEVEKYDRREAASVEVLKIVQKHRGWVDDETLRDLAAFLRMTADELEAIATFYPFIFRQPVGRHIIFVCDSVTCWIMGCDGILEHITNRLGIAPGETSRDGRFTLLPVSCVGRCDHAPVLMIDRDYHSDLDKDKLDRILDLYR